MLFVHQFLNRFNLVLEIYHEVKKFDGEWKLKSLIEEKKIEHSLIKKMKEKEKYTASTQK